MDQTKRRNCVRERERRRTESESDAEIGWSAGLQAGIEVPSSFPVKGGAVRSAGLQAGVVHRCERFLYDEDAGLETGAPEPRSEVGFGLRAVAFRAQPELWNLWLFFLFGPGLLIVRRRYLPFDELPAEPFAELPAELRSRELYEVGEWVNFVVDTAALEVLGEIGLEGDELETLLDAPMPERSDRVMALAERLGLAEDRRSCLVWIVDWLADPERTVGLAALRGLTLGEFPSLEEATRRAIEADARVRPHTELIALAASSYPAFLRGEEEGDRILFHPGSLELWESFFSNEHRVVEGLNRLGAHAVEARVGSRTDLRILELGGGLGSAAEALLERLAPAVARYSFTDVAPGFLRRGRDLLLERFPEAPVDVALVDINRAGEEQRLEPASYDIIYSVNVLHLARDLVSTLQAFGELLRPQGCMVFVEGVRPRPQRPIAAEFIFQLLPQFREVSTRADCRPTPGFLSASHWRRALELAGFSRIYTVPDFDLVVRAYPNQSMAAFVADR